MGTACDIARKRRTASISQPCIGLVLPPRRCAAPCRGWRAGSRSRSSSRRWRRPRRVAAQAPKTIRVAFPVAETGFDPQAIADNYSSMIAAAIFEPLYTYDYFALPAKLVPAAADALPEVSAGSHDLHDPAEARGCTSPTIRRSAASRASSPRRITSTAGSACSTRRCARTSCTSSRTGCSAATRRSRPRARAGAFDYDAPIAGLRGGRPLHDPRPVQRALLRLPPLAHVGDLRAVAREVVDKHKDASNRVCEHPVGTGPYRLAEWRRSQKIVLEANPGWRDVRYPAPVDAADTAIAKGLAGRKLPAGAARGDLDHRGGAAAPARRSSAARSTWSTCRTISRPTLLDGDKLKPEYAKRGIALHRAARARAQLHLLQPGRPGRRRLHAGEDRAAPRDALGYDRDTEIRILRNGQAAPATQISPPWTEGYDPTRQPLQKYDPAARARAARPLRLQGPRRRRLPRDARRQAADGREGVDAQRDRPRVRRAVEEEHGRDRHPDDLPSSRSGRTS